jgi:hypothetical protein
MGEIMAIVRFKVDASSASAHLRGKTDAIRAALVERTTAISVALADKIKGQLNGPILKIRTAALVNSVRVVPTAASGDQITGGVTAGGGPVSYAKYLEYGTSGPYVIRPKDPKGALALRVAGSLIFRKSVNHPGLRAFEFMRGTLEQSREAIVASYQDAVDQVVKG